MSSQAYVVPHPYNGRPRNQVVQQQFYSPYVEVVHERVPVTGQHRGQVLPPAPAFSPDHFNARQQPRMEDLRSVHQRLTEQQNNLEMRMQALEDHGASFERTDSGSLTTLKPFPRSAFRKKRRNSVTSLPPEQGPQTQTEAESAGDWVGISNNAYGAFIHQAFHVEVIGRKGALLQYGPMVIVSFLVQTGITYELWRELPKTRDPDRICPIHSNLQLAAIGVFLLVTFENIPKMYNALIITLFCKTYRKKGTKDPLTPDHPLRVPRRSTMFLFAVFSEFVAWFSILTVGLIWLLSATSHENIIRTTVAITFVNQVDEMVYSGCVTEERQDKHAEYEYRVGFQGSGSVKEMIDKAFDTYYTHFHLVTITGIACGITYGVRVSDVDCQPF